MSFRVRHAALVAAPAFVAFVTGVWGCSLGAQPDVVHDVDPTLPEVDASWNPVPWKPPVPGASEPIDAGAPVTPPEPPGPGRELLRARRGELVISEVMYDPSANEPSAEWFEIHCPAKNLKILSGLKLVDGAGRTHTIADGVVIEPDRYVVFARDRAAAIAARVSPDAIVYEYGTGLGPQEGILLGNGKTGSLTLLDGETTVAEAMYGGWFSVPGASVQLTSLVFAAGRDKASWCSSTQPWDKTNGSDKGTPGAASDCR